MRLAKIYSRLPIIVFDYKKKRVYPASEGYSITDCCVGSIREREIYHKNYTERGAKHATFRMYKCFDPAFHGTSKKKKRYGNLELTQSQYIRLLELNPDNLNDAFNKLIELSYIGEKRRDETLTAQRMAKRVLVEIVDEISVKIKKILE